LRLVACLFLAAFSLCGDGGAVQFRKHAGGLVITVFSAPVPLRAGRTDLSVMVQGFETETPLAGARVLLILSKAGEPDIRVEAFQAQSANKLLYSARPILPSAGEWLLDVRVESNSGAVTASATLPVLPPQSAIWTWWPYFAAIPAGVSLFCLNQWLKWKQRAPSSQI
jgi:hypothetical protein